MLAWQWCRQQCPGLDERIYSQSVASFLFGCYADTRYKNVYQAVATHSQTVLQKPLTSKRCSPGPETTDRFLRTMDWVVQLLHAPYDVRELPTELPGLEVSSMNGLRNTGRALYVYQGYNSDGCAYTLMEVLEYLYHNEYDDYEMREFWSQCAPLLVQLL
jgi:hypothetical protein